MNVEPLAPAARRIASLRSQVERCSQPSPTESFLGRVTPTARKACLPVLVTGGALFAAGLVSGSHLVTMVGTCVLVAPVLAIPVSIGTTIALQSLRERREKERRQAEIELSALTVGTAFSEGARLVGESEQRVVVGGVQVAKRK